VCRDTHNPVRPHALERERRRRHAFRQVNARRPDRRSERGIGADQEKQPSLCANPLELARDNAAIGGAKVPEDDGGSGRKRGSDLPRLRRALRIGEKPQTRQAPRAAKSPGGAAQVSCRTAVHALTRFLVTIELNDIRTRIAAAARAAGRDAAGIDLVAISKQQPVANVEAVLRAGQRHFGENRVQEAMARWSPLRPRFPDVRLRLVGPLQSNKAREAVAFFDAIDSLDRPKLAAALADAAQKGGVCPDILVQVNTGEEAQKAGVIPSEADAFIAEARGAFGLPVRGLMCIPPVDEQPAMHFALLAKIAMRNGLSDLSMGMSGDFETAIRFGATMVRVGSAVFGARA